VSDPVEAPVFCNQLFRSRDAALAAPRGIIELKFCPRCGHVFNAAFDPSLMQYSPEYENTLHCSGQFRAYASTLVDGLVRRYPIERGTIVEVGCGDGQFLTELSERAQATGIGFDPSYQGESGAVKGRVQIHRVPFGEQPFKLEPSLVCCRHVLEHIGTPGPFLELLRSAAPAGTSVFFEVPNALYTMRDGGIWDILYEHCGYFTPESLKACFELAGFAVNGVEETFAGQFLTLHGVMGEKAAPESVVFDGTGSSTLLALAEKFRSFYAEKTREFRSKLAEFQAAGRKVAIWGAGTKGVMFLNIVGTGHEVAVDLNPKKHGMFIAGTGQPIVAPASLKDAPPDLVIVMNPVYAGEIRGTLSELGLAPELIVA
jgi:hypothetical protein